MLFDSPFSPFFFGETLIFTFIIIIIIIIFFDFSGVNGHPKLTFDFNFKFNFGHILLEVKWKVLKYSSTTAFSCLKTRLKQDYGE